MPGSPRKACPPALNAPGVIRQLTALGLPLARLRSAVPRRSRSRAPSRAVGVSERSLTTDTGARSRSRGCPRTPRRRDGRLAPRCVGSRRPISALGIPLRTTTEHAVTAPVRRASMYTASRMVMPAPRRTSRGMGDSTVLTKSGGHLRRPGAVTVDRYASFTLAAASRRRHGRSSQRKSACAAPGGGGRVDSHL